MMKPTFSKDVEANAGYISFLENIPVAITVPVSDGKSVIAALDFDDSGALVGVELLNANVQMGKMKF